DVGVDGEVAQRDEAEAIAVIGQRKPVRRRGRRAGEEGGDGEQEGAHGRECRLARGRWAHGRCRAGGVSGQWRLGLGSAVLRKRGARGRAGEEAAFLRLLEQTPQTLARNLESGGLTRAP